MGGSSTPSPQQMPAPPQKTDAEIQAELAKQRQLNRARKGRGASILAGDTNFLQPANDQGRATLG